MKKLIRKIFRKIIRELAKDDFLIKEIENNYFNYKTKVAAKNIVIQTGTVLYPECHIVNKHANKKRISIGEHCHIRGEILTFESGGEISIGNFCYLGSNSRIWSAEKIIIGNRVLISHNVNITDNIAHPLDSNARHIDFRRIIGLDKIVASEDVDLKARPITIKDDVWIGFNSIILKGVTIGKGAVIGAGTLITDNVPDYAIVAGNPPAIKNYTT